jgi:hypothetical protein
VPPPPASAEHERPWAQLDAPEAPGPHVAAQPLDPPRAALPAPAVPALPAAAPVPHVRVSFLLYSRVTERRTVSLSVDDGSLVTLHEGQQASGVEVTRIFPDRVELRRDGQDFTVRARD